MGGNLALHILFTNESEGPGIRQGLIDGHISQTDRMASVFMLSDVDVSVIYPNQNLIAPRRWITTIPLIEPLRGKGPRKTALEPH